LPTTLGAFLNSRAGLLSIVVAVLHIPLWVGPAADLDGFGAIRSLTALAALLMLGWLHRPLRYDGSSLLAASLLLVSSALAIAANDMLWLWAVSLPVGVLGVIAGIEPLSWSSKWAARYAAWLGLAVLSFPYEIFSARADPMLQHVTAWFAAPMVRLTGLEVHLDSPDGYVLLGERLQVTVTDLCAGSQTFLALSTLAFVIAEVFVPAPRARLLVVLFTPALGFCGNVLRVVLSTHAAKWLGSGTAWNVAHDFIGYVLFVVLYGCLFIGARRLSRVPSS